MSVKCNVNLSNFDFSEYDKTITEYVSKNYSMRESEEKSANLFNRFLESGTIKIAHQEDSEDYKFIINSIKEIISYAPGSMLIDRLINTKQNVTISCTDGDHFFEDATNTVLINKNANLYNVVCDSNKNKHFQKMTPVLGLIHELIHALHFTERSCVESNNTDPLVLEGMDNVEEQRTITGLAKDGIDLINENTFNKIYGLLCRINHRGIKLLGNDNPSALDAAGCGALAHLKLELDKDPSLLNQYQISEGLKYTLLSAAISGRQDDVVEYLLSRADIDIHLSDDSVKGPLQAAIEAGNVSLVERLVKMGAKPIPNSLRRLLQIFRLVDRCPIFEAEKNLITSLLKAIPWNDQDQKIVNCILNGRVLDKRLGIEGSLEIAIATKDLDVIQFFVNMRAKPQSDYLEKLLHSFNSANETEKKFLISLLKLIHWNEKDQKIVTFLLSGNSLNNIEDSLADAIKTKDLEIVRFCLDKGAKPDPDSIELFLKNFSSKEEGVSGIFCEIFFALNPNT